MRRGRKAGKKALFYTQPRAYPNRLWRHWTYQSTKIITPHWRPLAPAQPATLHACQFRANSIYDPDFEAGGQTCIGQGETLMGWDHYVVVYSKISCIFTPLSTVTTAGGGVQPTANNQIPVFFGLALRDDPTWLDDITVRMLSTDRLCNFHTATMGSIVGGSAPSFKLNLWYNARRFFNCDPTDKETLCANPAANPAELAYFQIVSAPMIGPLVDPGANDYGSWSCTIHLDYWGWCMEPRAYGAIA